MHEGNNNFGGKDNDSRNTVPDTMLGKDNSRVGALSKENYYVYKDGGDNAEKCCGDRADDNNIEL